MREDRIHIRIEIAMLDKIISGIGSTMIANGCRSYFATSGETIVAFLSRCFEHGELAAQKDEQVSTKPIVAMKEGRSS